MRRKIHIGNALYLAIVLHFVRKILRKVSSEGNRVVHGGSRKYMFFPYMHELTVIGDASDRLKDILEAEDDLNDHCVIYTAAEVDELLHDRKFGVSHPCHNEYLNGISIAYDGGRSAGEFMDELCMCRTSRR